MAPRWPWVMARHFLSGQKKGWAELSGQAAGPWPSGTLLCTRLPLAVLHYWVLLTLAASGFVHQ